LAVSGISAARAATRHLSARETKEQINEIHSKFSKDWNPSRFLSQVEAVRMSRNCEISQLTSKGEGVEMSIIDV
jgi:hypothetical protein